MTTATAVASILALDCERMAASLSKLGPDAAGAVLILSAAALALRAGHFDSHISQAIEDQSFVATIRWLAPYLLEHPRA